MTDSLTFDAGLLSPADVIGPRLASRVEVAEDGCWIWTGARNPGGYGQAWVAGKMARLHRIAYLSVHGTVPDGLELDHVCRVTSCCNPDHLEAVTHAENIQRGSQGRKRPAPKTHCSRGHELTPENRTVPAAGRARGQCRRCANDNRNQRDRAKRAARSEDNVTPIDGKAAAAGPDR